jgi:hypothetical protein
MLAHARLCGAGGSGGLCYGTFGPSSSCTASGNAFSTESRRSSASVACVFGKVVWSTCDGCTELQQSSCDVATALQWWSVGSVLRSARGLQRMARGMQRTAYNVWSVKPLRCLITVGHHTACSSPRRGSGSGASGRGGEYSLVLTSTSVNHCWSPSRHTRCSRCALVCCSMKCSICFFSLHSSNMRRRAGDHNVLTNHARRKNARP